MAVADQKRELRTRSAQRRATAANDSPTAVHDANVLLAEAVGAQATDIVAGYRPIRSELDPTPAMQLAARQGATLCLPAVTARDAPLVFRTWQPGDPLRIGAYRVEVPTRDQQCEPTVVIVPLLAWDRQGGRLGYGGGFYDRTLRELRSRGTIRAAIGLAYAAQEVAEVPRTSTDQLLDAVVTELEVIHV